MLVTTCLELSVPASAASVRAVREIVAETCVRAGVADDVADDIRLCVSEAVTNAVVHAYGSNAGLIDVVVEIAGDELTVVVGDQGRGLTAFQPKRDGYGFRIIDGLTLRHAISSAPNVGTEVRMVFPVSGPSARSELHNRAA